MFVNIVSSAILNSQAGYRCTLVPKLPFPVPRFPFPVTSFSNILLLLSFWNLFNKDPRHCMPSSKRVSNLYATTFSNPESHSHLSLVDVITVTFNMAVTVEIAALAGFHVERAINRARRGTLGAIEGEIPTTTAVVTSSNPEVTSKVNMEGSVCEVLYKFTVLQR